MRSKKRLRSMYTSDDSDAEFNDCIIHEEQTTFENNRARRRIIISKTPSDIACGNDKTNTLVIQNDVEDDLDDFFSSAVHEVITGDISSEILPPESDSSDDDSSDNSEDDLVEDIPPTRTRFRSLEDFRDLKAEFLTQFLRRFCPRSVSETCGACGIDGAAIICTDCFIFQTRCQACVIKEHRHLPLHRIQYFDSSVWRKISLQDLGLIVNFGHSGAPCPASDEPKKIVVIDIKGIQEITVLFCSCERSSGVDGTERSQLINHGFYPATTEHPGTVATFSTMDTFELLSGEGKLSGYHFYRSIVRMKDGAGYENIPRRYEEFMRMSREYQHLKMLLRAGKITDPFRPLAIADGELAVQCPACPHPGRNLPESWEKKVDSWIYTLFIMVDANFRLKSKKKRNVNDLALGDGASYFVRREPYMQHLEEVTDEKEIKYCTSGLRAVDHANLKGGQGYNASGVVGVQCRHMLFRSNGFGDLQKGEKHVYANVDYVVLSALKDRSLKRVIMSYDIACQYSRNFPTRMIKYGEGLRLDLSKVDLEFIIPQFHVAGHGDKCRTRFNLRFREHVGRTDGENIERGWAGLNPLSMSSKEMGLGARQDYLDWHIGDWNYQRIVSFGRIFSRKLQEAASEGIKHSNILYDFRKTFPKNIVKDIEDTIKAWDKDPLHSANPYAVDTHGKVMVKTRKALTKAEMEEGLLKLQQFGSGSETQWLAMGLELEDSQHSIKLMYKHTCKGETSTTALEKNASALRKLRAWKAEQLLHMPLISQSPEWNPVQENGKTSSLRCWKIKLNLPSSVSSAQRGFVCSNGLVQKEFKLRLAQATDSLAELRHILQKLWWMMKMKKKHVSGPGQKLNTKSNCAIDVVVDQREKEVARYRRARNALAALEPQGHWQDQFRVLRDEDVRHFEDDDGKGEGRRTLSWIWVVEGATTSQYKEDGDVYADLKVEYAKARARTSRWLEEATLIREEMRRVISYINWKIGWWLERNSQLTYRDDEAALGAIVYGNGQVVILQKLGQKFWQQWQSECGILNLPEVRNDSLVEVKRIRYLPLLPDT